VYPFQNLSPPKKFIIAKWQRSTISVYCRKKAIRLRRVRAKPSNQAEEQRNNVDIDEGLKVRMKGNDSLNKKNRQLTFPWV